MSKPGRGAGLQAMLAGYFFFGVAPVFAKAAMQRGWNGPHAICFRFLVGGLLTLAIAWTVRRWGARAARREFRLRQGNGKGLFLRGLYGGIAASCYFGSLALAGAGLGTLLNYTYTIFAVVLGYIIHGHRPSGRFWALMGLSLTGLVLVVDPFGPKAAVPGLGLGVGLGLAAGFFGGLSILAIKQLRETDNALSINAAYSLMSFLLGIPTLLYSRSQGSDIPWSDAAAWALVLLAALCSFGGQMFFNHGFKHCSVAQASLTALMAPAIAVWGGWAFLGEGLSPHFLAGALLILAANFLAPSLDTGPAPGAAARLSALS